MNETFTFETLGELRTFLNNFTDTDLDTVYPHDSDHITLHWLPQTLSDESTVYNVNITTS